MESVMRVVVISLAALVLISGTGLAGDPQMASQADDHAAHGMPDHGVMDHGNMDHGDGHMMGSQTMPADGAVLSASPSHIGVNFGHAMTLEGVRISTFTGEMVELDVSPVGATDHFMLEAPELQPDDYIVDWRARGSDGHRMSGSFAFTVE